MSRPVLHIACVVEENYVAHSATMLHSLLAHAKDHEVHVHYLHPPEFPVKVLEPLRGMVEEGGGRLVPLEVGDDVSKGLPVEGFTRKATWYRIFLPRLLGELDRLLFLDCDLVVTDSVAELWQTDVGDGYVAAVTNVFMVEHLFRVDELGLADPRDYFNAGVMLMNLEAMRRDGCTEAMYEYGTRHASELVFRDQDVLNVILGKRRTALHPRWNVMNSVVGFPYSPYVLGVRAVDEARRDPAIRHFEGPGLNKPWHAACDFEGRELYAEHRRHTPWPDFELEGEPPPAPRRLPALLRRARRRISA
jgi:lipopolysaccharide biosynthesis glycosyltransferase